VIGLALMLAACTPSMPLSPESTEIPANLSTSCPPLPQVRDGQAGTVLRWGAQVVELYAECSSRHRRLAEAWPR
jgi:hypothetical protein